VACNDTVTEFNASDGSFIRNLAGGSYNFSFPDGLTFGGGHIWIANGGNSTIIEVNAGDGSFIRNLSSGSYNFSDPFALVFDGRHVWVANFGNSTVTELNVGDGSLVANLSSGNYGFSDPASLALRRPPHLGRELRQQRGHRTECRPRQLGAHRLRR
jgi:DNA-binding beta-propeller fold protein YncE